MEVQKDPVWKLIDTAAYLFMNQLFEPRDNSLTVVLEEAGVNEPARTSRTIVGVLFSGVAPIEPLDGSKVFVLQWKSYVSYCVTEEMHGSCGNFKDALYEGRLLRIYSKSPFLDFLAQSTGAHFGDYRHYMIACQNHIIDVASTSEPALQAMTRKEAQASGTVRQQ